MGGNADNAVRAEHSPRVLKRQIILSQMDSVRADRTGNICMVIEDDDPASPFHRLDNGPRRTNNGSPRTCLVSVLEQADPGRKRCCYDPVGSAKEKFLIEDQAQTADIILPDYCTAP